MPIPEISEHAYFIDTGEDLYFCDETNQRLVRVGIYWYEQPVKQSQWGSIADTTRHFGATAEVCALLQAAIQSPTSKPFRSPPGAAKYLNECRHIS